jgi:hypothetical protein
VQSDPVFDVDKMLSSGVEIVTEHAGVEIKHTLEAVRVNEVVGRECDVAERMSGTDRPDVALHLFASTMICVSSWRVVGWKT